MELSQDQFSLILFFLEHPVHSNKSRHLFTGSIGAAYIFICLRHKIKLVSLNLLLLFQFKNISL